MGRPDDAIDGVHAGAFDRAEREACPLAGQSAAARRGSGRGAVLQQALELGEDGDVLATMGQVMLAELGSPDALAVLERAIDGADSGCLASIASVLTADDASAAPVWTAPWSGSRASPSPRAPGVRPHPPG